MYFQLIENWQQAFIPPLLLYQTGRAVHRWFCHFVTHQTSLCPITPASQCSHFAEPFVNFCPVLILFKYSSSAPCESIGLFLINFWYLCHRSYVIGYEVILTGYSYSCQKRRHIFDPQSGQRHFPRWTVEGLMSATKVQSHPRLQWLDQFGAFGGQSLTPSSNCCTLIWLAEWASKRTIDQSEREVELAGRPKWTLKTTKNTFHPMNLIWVLFNRF